MSIELFKNIEKISLKELRYVVDSIPQHLLIPCQYAFYIKSTEKTDKFIKSYHKNEIDIFKGDKLTHLVYLLTPFKNYSIKQRMDYGISGINYPIYIGDKELQDYFNNLEHKARKLMRNAAEIYRQRYTVSMSQRIIDSEYLKTSCHNLEEDIEKYLKEKEPADPFEFSLPYKKQAELRMLFAIPCDIDVRDGESDMVTVGPKF